MRPPIVAASTYVLAGDPGAADLRYGRLDNPTWQAVEERLGEMEGGTATIFASGMAAVTAVLTGLVDPGETVLLPEDGYYTLRNLANECLTPNGVQVRYCPTAGEYRECARGASLIWAETPSNPGLNCVDIARLAESREPGTTLVVDNTLATAVAQRPLELGADYSVLSLTKTVGGHFDLVAGAVVARTPELADPIRRRRNLTGSVLGPFDAWLVERSLMTLRVRVLAQCRSALKIARWLQDKPGVVRVRYPGLQNDPGHVVAVRQMAPFGPVVGVEFQGAAQAERFLSGLQHVVVTTSFGGVVSTAERRARWSDDRSPEGYVRLSVGCEDLDLLIDDLGRGIDAVTAAGG